jgi:hypothetical protein
MTIRQFSLILLAIALFALPLSHSTTWAQKKNGPPPKVALCHFPNDKVEGHVIEVSAHAVAAHLSKHGDCTEYVALEGDACRCLTCDETCNAAADACTADCTDSACEAACAADLATCLAACEE